MLREVSFAAGKASVGIRLTTPLCPSRDEIRASAQAAAQRVAGVTSVDVAFTAEVARKDGPARQRLPKVRNIIAVAAGKGGVGKSTVATNLAVALAKQGTRVGILDADVFGPSIPQMMGQPDTASDIRDEHTIVPAIHHGIKVLSVGFFVERGAAVMWRGPMIHKLLTQFVEDVDWGELDYLVVDLPPGTGDVVISLVQTVPLTGAVVVSTPSDVSLEDARKALEMFAQVNVEVLGMVENMSHFTCPHCQKEIDIFSKGGAERTAKQFNVPFLGSIELVPAIREGGDRGLPVALAGPKSPQAAEFYAVAEKLIERANAAAASATDVIEIS